MDEYISREKVLETIRYRVCQGRGNKEHICKRGSCAYCGIMEIMSDISSIEAASVRPVKQGRWLDNGIVYTCSECNSSVPKNIFVIGCDFEGCPYCFARMAVTENENTNPKGKIDIDRLLTDMDGDKDNNARNLTDEETTIYKSWIESEAKDTGVNIMDGDSE